MENYESKLQKENLELKERLREAEETLSAIQKGDVDAIVVKGPKGEVLYSLVSAEHPYQVFIDKMIEAALIVSLDGIILYANPGFINMIEGSSQTVIGSSLLQFVEESQRPYFFNRITKHENKKSEFIFITQSKEALAVAVSVSKGVWQESESLCLLLNNRGSCKTLINRDFF